MAQPTPYNRAASFSNIQAQAPDDPLPGNTLDTELNAIKATLDEVLANIELIQRDDGELANESVGYDQLSTELSAGINRWEPWVTATDYAVGDTVFHGSAVYRAEEAHTAGTFATDLGAAKWTLIIDLSALTIVDASNIANTPAGTVAATTVQAAIDELAAEKAALSHTHLASAISDSTAAGRGMLSAANVAAQQALLGLGDLAFEDTIPVTDIDAQIAFSGIIEPAALGASVNDWAPTGVATASTIRLSASTTGVSITGILAPATDGEIKILENVGTTHPVTLAASSASSAAANRFLLPKTVVLGPNTACALKYDHGDDRWRLLVNAPRLPRGWIDGLKLSNNASDAVNDIDVAAGEVRGTRGILDMALPSSITKRLDADFTAGTGNGMRYSGAALTTATYHIFLIGKADSTTDIFAYTGVDPTAVLPTDYIDYRRIGSIMYESTTIVPFKQNGDYFTRVTLSQTGYANPGTSAVNRAVGVPTGIKVCARVFACVLNTGGSTATYALFTDIDENNETPSNTKTHIPTTFGSAAGVTAASVTLDIWTDTSGQIRSRLSFSDASVQLTMAARGWTDRRDRDA